MGRQSPPSSPWAVPGRCARLRVLADAYRARGETVDWGAVCRDLGVSTPSACRMKEKELRDAEAAATAEAGARADETSPLDALPTPEPIDTTDPDTGERTIVYRGGMIHTLDQLLAHCQVDREAWEVTAQYVNSWPMISARGVVEQAVQVKATLKPRRERQILEDIWGHLMLAIERERAGRGPVPAPEVLIRRPRMLELCPMDVHLGKQCWGEETGDNYDLHIAERDYRACITELLESHGGGLEEILLPFGNDFFHFDNLQRTTTGGTPQDGDSRYAKMYALGVELNVWTLEECLRRAKRVKGVAVPGNHDRQSIFTLGCTLDAWFRAEPRLVIDNRPKLRKYHQYGVNMIGWTHGSEEKLQDLAVVMATEEPAMWAATQYRELHAGHLHKMKAAYADSVRGVRFRIMPSISGTDAWHYSKAFGDRRAMEAYLFDRDKGYAGHFSANVAPATTDGETLEAAA